MKLEVDVDITIIQKGWICTKGHLTNSAWAYSRPNSDGSEHGLLELDASINELPSVVVAIKSTAIEREIITSLRDHVIWARTSRVDDVTKFTTPEYFSSHEDLYQSIRTSMEMLREQHVSQDEYRLLLPIVHETEYMARFSMRALHKLFHEFVKLAMTTNTPEASLMFTDASSKINLILKDMGITHDKCKYKDLLPAFKKHEWYNSERVHSVVSVRLSAPFSLRTHLVRHRSITILDNLREICCDQNIGMYDLSTQMFIEASGTVNDWDHVLSKRSCWMAHQGLWAQLSKMIADKLDKNVTLPCSDGICPFEVDAKKRFYKVDPGSPCPEYMRLHDIRVTREQKDDMLNTAITENRNLSWLDTINGLEPA